MGHRRVRHRLCRAGTTYQLAGGTLTWTYEPISFTDNDGHHCTRTAEPLTVELELGDGEMVAGAETAILLSAVDLPRTPADPCPEIGQAVQVG